MIDRRRERHSPDRDAADTGWRQELERLPEEVRPDHDLWPGIAGRLTPRTMPWWRRLGPEGAFGGLSRPVLAVAVAVLVLAIGSTLWSHRQQSIPPVSVAAGTPASTVVPVDATAPGDELLRLRRELLASLEDRRGQVAPETVAMVEETLAVLDAAIAQVRAAMAEDPGNVYLNHMLADEYRREAAVLDKLKRI